jgi:antitoxin PrlF
MIHIKKDLVKLCMKSKQVLASTMHLHYHGVLQKSKKIMSAILSAESTLTDRYQTTVPDAVRKALHLDKRDRLRYTVLADGVVQLSRLDAIEVDDPAISGFLNFLANNMTAHPQHLQPITSALRGQIQQLTAGVNVNLTDTLSPEDD